MNALNHPTRSDTRVARPRYSAPASIALLLLMALSGCSVLPESDPVQWLDPRPVTQTATGPADWSISIGRPESDPARDSTRVLVRTADARLQVLPSIRWVAPAPELFRTLAVRHLRDAGALRRVEAAGARTDRTLLSDLRRFELAETDSDALRATIEIEFRLYDAGTAGLADRTLLQRTVRVESAAAPDLLRAFEAALSETLDELTEWLISQSPPEPSG
jgi:cholesterol transport system auxiliary component